jgi:NodT family efflux transporter outer membrane factor (OMF) lipoprotein
MKQLPLCLTALSLLHACAQLGPSRATLPVEAPATWSSEQRGPLIRSDWWTGFGDQTLVGLVEEALRSNLDLRLAAARLSEAAALATAQRASMSPSLDAVAAVQQSRDISAVTGRPYVSTTASPQLLLSYDIDLFGRLSALVEAARTNEEGQRAARDAVAINVAGATAASYITLRTAQAQLEVSARSLMSRAESLRLTRSRHESGYGSALEAAQAEAEVESAARTVKEFEAVIRRHELALCVLLGRLPGHIESGAPLASLTVPPLPDTGLPSELLRRRPDIAQAEWQVVGADASLAASRAQMLPTLRLSASLGQVTSSALRGDPFSLWSIGGNVLGPLFEGGRLRALSEASASRLEEASVNYRRVVLTAFSEVEAQLDAYQRITEQGAHANAELNAASEALRIAHRRFTEGQASYLDELIAQRTAFSAEQTTVRLRGELLATQVNMYRVLGGGWSAGSQSQTGPR